MSDQLPAEPYPPLDTSSPLRIAVQVEGERPPPRRLSSDQLHKDFHPSYSRVGLRIDGEERSNVTWYDADALVYRANPDPKTLLLAASIEPYWRFAESRQMRRARQRWEGKK